MGAVAGLGLLLASCASESSLTRVQVTAPSSRSLALEEQIYDGVNSFRKTQGLGMLLRHRGLDDLARQHAQFMLANSGKFGLYGKTVTHTGFHQRAMVAQHKYNMSAVGENVIASHGGGSVTGAKLVRGWRGSSEHLQNLTESWKLTGIGVAVGEDGTVCATQLFGIPGTAQSRFAGPALW